MKVTKLGTSPVPKFEPFSLQLDFETVDDLATLMVVLANTSPASVRADARKNSRIVDLLDNIGSMHADTYDIYRVLSEEVSRLLP